jgi:hypothetical protein
VTRCRKHWNPRLETLRWDQEWTKYSLLKTTVANKLDRIETLLRKWAAQLEKNFPKFLWNPTVHYRVHKSPPFMELWNDGILPQHYMASQLRRPRFAYWRWKQHGPLKRWSPITLYGITTQKTSTWNVTAEKASKFAYKVVLHIWSVIAKTDPCRHTAQTGLRPIFLVKWIE